MRFNTACIYILITCFFQHVWIQTISQVLLEKAFYSYVNVGQLGILIGTKNKIFVSDCPNPIYFLVSEKCFLHFPTSQLMSVLNTDNDDYNNKFMKIVHMTLLQKSPEYIIKRSFPFWLRVIYTLDWMKNIHESVDDLNRMDMDIVIKAQP